MRQQIDQSANVASDVLLYGEVDVRSGATVEQGAVIGASGGGRPADALRTVIGEKAFIGSRAIILAGVSVGAGAVVRPGTVLGADAPPMAIVEGNPGSVCDYVEPQVTPTVTIDGGTWETGGGSGLPGGATFVALRRVVDLRGSLIICEHKDLPFTVKRTFFVTNVASGLFRGAHAHRQCIQALFCVQGSVSCLLDDSIEKINVNLTRPEIGLVIPPLVWASQYQFSPGSVLVVYASHEYNPGDYIKSYEDFISGVEP